MVGTDLMRWAMSLVIAAGLGGAAASAPAVAAEEPVPIAQDARIAGDETRTRFVLDVDGAIDVAAFVLADPYRIILDLSEVRFALPQDVAAQGRGLIAGWRYGRFAKGKSRIVIDMNSPARVDKQFVLPAVDGQPARLVLDLVKSTRDDFLKEVAKTAELARSDHHVAGKGDRLPIGPKEARVRPLIVLDPGHGGIDSGAVGKTGTLEKAVVLDFASVLKRKLEETGRFEVKLTRTDDSFIPLGRRVKIARDVHADLFVSIHADSVRQNFVRGATVYTLSERASDRLSEQVAAQENQSDILAGIEIQDDADDVGDILIDLTRRETKNFSVFFANMLVGEMRSAAKLINNPHRSAGFRVLKAPDIPSVLVEIGYLSNEHDEQLLKSDDWRTRTAEAIAVAVDRFFAPRLSAAENAGDGESVAGVVNEQQ